MSESGRVGVSLDRRGDCGYFRKKIFKKRAVVLCVVLALTPTPLLASTASLYGKHKADVDGVMTREFFIKIGKIFYARYLRNFTASGQAEILESYINDQDRRRDVQEALAAMIDGAKEIFGGHEIVRVSASLGIRAHTKLIKLVGEPIISRHDYFVRLAGSILDSLCRTARIALWKSLNNVRPEPLSQVG